MSKNHKYQVVNKSVLWGKTTSVVIMTIALSSCSLVNPHVTADMERPSPTDNSAAIKFAGDLPRAIDFANSTRTAYYNAVGDQSKLRNGLALTLVPISAAALFLGITSTNRASRDFITGAAVGGAGAFGLASLLESEPREAVYLAGSQAVGCAVQAMQPLLIPQNTFSEFQRALGELGPRTVAVGTAKLKVQPYLSGDVAGLAPQDIAFGKSLVDQADDLQNQVNTIKSRGTDIEAKVETAGVTLVSAVDLIRDQVSVQIVRTEPDLNAISSVIGSLGQRASGLAGDFGSAASAKRIADAFKASGLVPPSEQRELEATGVVATRANFYKAVEKLTDAAFSLAGDLSIVARVVDRVAEEDVKNLSRRISACKVAAAEVEISVQPPAETVALAKGDVYLISVSGGKRPYSAKLVGKSAPDGVAISRSLDNENDFVVTVGAAVTTADFHLQILDAAGESSKTIRFTVGGASGGVGAGVDLAKLPGQVFKVGGVDFAIGPPLPKFENERYKICLADRKANSGVADDAIKKAIADLEGAPKASAIDLVDCNVLT